MECDRIKDMMSPFLDGELSESDERSVREHLDGCAECRKEMADLRRVSTLYRNLVDPELPADFNDRVYADIGRIKLGRNRFRLFPISVLASAATLVLLAGAVFMINRMPTTNKDMIAKSPKPQIQVGKSMLRSKGKIASQTVPPTAESIITDSIDSKVDGLPETIPSEHAMKRSAGRMRMNMPMAAASKPVADTAVGRRDKLTYLYGESEPNHAVRVADRTFRLVDGVWTDIKYDGTSKTQDIVYGSAEYTALRDKNPAIGKYLALGQKVIFLLEGKWYRIVEKREATPTR